MTLGQFVVPRGAKWTLRASSQAGILWRESGNGGTVDRDSGGIAGLVRNIRTDGSTEVTETTEKLCAGYFSFKALRPTPIME
jgi:hypothetical protein